MKKILILLSITIYACTKDYKLDGIYKFKSCNNTELTCDYFEIFKDGTFRYNIILDSKQHESFIGSWKIKQDTVFLELNPFVTPDSTNVLLLDNKCSSETNISVNMLSGYQEGEKPDTSKVQWYVSVDGGKKFISTDIKGNLSIKKQYIHEIKIHDIMQETAHMKIFRNKDSIFEINAEVDEIKIYLALTERYPDELDFMPKKLLWTGDKLYPIYCINNTIYKKKDGIYYRRTSDIIQ